MREVKTIEDHRRAQKSSGELWRTPADRKAIKHL